MIIVLVLVAIFWIPLILYAYWLDNGLKYGGGLTDKIMRGKHKKTVDTSLDVLINTAKILEVPYVFDLLKGVNTCMEYKDIPRREKYKPTKNMLRTSVHNGQLKLLLTEIQFLTLVLTNMMQSAYVIYAGSAPSHKLGILMAMFPGVRFILVDPHEHLIMYPTYSDRVETQYDGHVDEILYFKTAAGNRFDLQNRKVKTREGIVKRGEQSIGDITNDIAMYIKNHPHKLYIIEDYMTNELASILGGLENTYFISDIRSNSEEQAPTDADINWNSAMQYNWIVRMKPLRYMLKFHPPYGDDSKPTDYMREALSECPIDFTIKKNKWKYLKAEHIFVQAFAPQSSSETRLIGSTLELQEYDIREYEDKFYYYNTYHRQIGRHNSQEPYVDYNLGVDTCGDCAIMCQILADYCTKFTTYVSRETILGMIKTTLQSIDRMLVSNMSLHAASDISNLKIESTVDIVKFVYLIHCARSFASTYRRLNDKPTAANQRYRAGIKNLLMDIIGRYELADNSSVEEMVKSPDWKTKLARTIMVSINTFDIYGNTMEFQMDIAFKLYCIFKDYAEATAEIVNGIQELYEAQSGTDAPASVVDNEIVTNNCRKISKHDLEICTLINSEKWPSSKNKELDMFIDKIISEKQLDGVVEICTLRTDSYFDYVIEGYSPPRTVDNTSYEAYCFYGGLPLVLNKKYPNKLIIINMHGVSLMMIQAIYNWVTRMNSSPIIVISKWNYINHHGRLLTDKTCGLDCKEITCSHLFINTVNCE